MKNLYHVTAVDKVNSILEQGLRANVQGAIFAISNKRRWYELGLPCFSLPNNSALLAVDTKGITGSVRHHSRYCCEIHQTIIEPKYLTLLWSGRDSYFLKRSR